MFATIPQMAATCMTRDTFIKHKEATMIYEKNGPVIVYYNVLIIQPKSKKVAQPIVQYIITK